MLKRPEERHMQSAPRDAFAKFRITVSSQEFDGTLFTEDKVPSGIFKLKGLPEAIRICVCKSYKKIVLENGYVELLFLLRTYTNLFSFSLQMEFNLG